MHDEEILPVKQEGNNLILPQEIPGDEEISSDE